jgi:hypothetical protein
MMMVDARALFSRNAFRRRDARLQSRSGHPKRFRFLNAE